MVKPVRRAGSTEELIPAGAIVHGRIRRVEHHLLPTPYILVAMSFNRVDVRGVLSPFVARSEPDAALARELDANLAIRETGIWFWDVGTFCFPPARATRDSRRIRIEVVHAGHRRPLRIPTLATSVVRQRTYHW